MLIKITLTIIIICNLILFNNMIICICNSLSDKLIHQAIKEGATTSWQVYSHCGVKPQCGSCSDYIKESIDFINKEEKKDIA